MPEYKKKKVKGRNRTKNKTNANSDIKMKPSQRGVSTPSSNVKVVKGGKLVRMRKVRILAATVTIIVLICVALDFILPVGLVEGVTNFTAGLGGGSYPISVFGSEILDVKYNRTGYFMLTDAKLTAINDSGKEMLSVNHGYSNPYLVTGETRALVFDQGGNEACVFNLKEKTNDIITKEKIVNASIGRDGTFAIVTHSDSYAASVTVYGENSEILYEWNSAKDLISGVAISGSGKAIAVGTVHVENGQYKTAVRVLEFDSADAKSTTDLNGQIPLMLDSNNKGISVISENAYNFIRWNKNDKTEIKSDYSIDKFRKSSGRILLSLNHEGNKSENIIMLLDTKGHKICEFEYNGNITDIAPYGNHIYCLTEDKIIILDKEGNVLRSGKSGYGATRIKVLNSNNVAIISNTSIEKITLNKEGE